jgi:uncharacterized protein YpbB
MNSKVSLFGLFRRSRLSAFDHDLDETGKNPILDCNHNSHSLRGRGRMELTESLQPRIFRADIDRGNMSAFGDEHH